MTNPLKQSVSRMRPGAASAALALASVLVIGVAATQSAQAQRFTVLHTFTGEPTDGANPYAGMIMDAKGNFYGTTTRGGAQNGGTVFELTKAGKEKALYSFGVYPDGAYPYAGLVMDAKGNLYGTTESGGDDMFYGTVFKVSKSSKETVLHSFGDDSGDGVYPYAGLVMDTKGNLYGTASFYGSDGYGTVWKLTP